MLINDSVDNELQLTTEVVPSPVDSSSNDCKNHPKINLLTSKHSINGDVVEAAHIFSVIEVYSLSSLFSPLLYCTVDDSVFVT
jgi:hypothetical protein